MELFKSIFTYLIEGFKHFYRSGLGEPITYLFLIACVVLLLVKVFKR